MLSNAYFVAKFRFDTAENEPAKNLQNLKFSKKCIFEKCIFRKVDLLLNCYDPSRPEVLMTYLGMALVCLFSYPLLQFAARKMLLRVAGYEDQVDHVPYPFYVAVGVATKDTSE